MLVLDKEKLIDNLKVGDTKQIESQERKSLKVATASKD